MGKIVNNYELLEQLGQGGMGVVYKARHINFDEIVAIKRLWEQFSNDQTVLNLFRNEGKILRKLHHKNIVQVSDLFEYEGSHFIVMEYIEGRTLSEIIKRETGPIRRERAINLFKQMLEGVAYFHNQPETIIHRDIKPLNILVTKDDTVKITDFGIAKALDSGGHSTTVKGTPVYMSPEQIINPKTVDIRTDVYSLGMTFYEMLCAKTPFSGDTTTTPTAVYTAIMNGDVPPPTEFYPGISNALSDFVMKAIHKDRNQRFADANEMLIELEKLESSGATTFKDVPKFILAVDARPRLTDNLLPKTVIDTPRRWWNNTRNWIAGFVLVLVLILGISFVWKKLVNDKIQMKGSKSTVKTDTGLKPLYDMILVENPAIVIRSNHTESDLGGILSVFQDYRIGKNEVTQELWESVMGSNPSIFKGDKKPVDNISWYDAIEFCNKLSEKEGLQKAYIINGSSVGLVNGSNGYRLPNNEQWEFAAIGGNSDLRVPTAVEMVWPPKSGKERKGYKYKFSGSNNIGEVAWYSGNSGKQTQDVAQKKPNKLGIYDMSGNVWEWCWDWQDMYSSSMKPEPRGPDASRILRGGSFESNAENCDITYLKFENPSNRESNFGLRLVREQ